MISNHVIWYKRQHRSTADNTYAFTSLIAAVRANYVTTAVADP